MMLIDDAVQWNALEYLTYMSTSVKVQIVHGICSFNDYSVQVLTMRPGLSSTLVCQTFRVLVLVYQSPIFLRTSTLNLRTRKFLYCLAIIVEISIIELTINFAKLTFVLQWIYEIIYLLIKLKITNVAYELRV